MKPAVLKRVFMKFKNYKFMDELDALAAYSQSNCLQIYGCADILFIQRLGYEELSACSVSRITMSFVMYSIIKY